MSELAKALTKLPDGTEVVFLKSLGVGIMEPGDIKIRMTQGDLRVERIVPFMQIELGRMCELSAAVNVMAEQINNYQRITE